MNARPSIFLPASEEADLIVSRWQREGVLETMNGHDPAQHDAAVAAGALEIVNGPYHTGSDYWQFGITWSDGWSQIFRSRAEADAFVEGYAGPPSDPSPIGLEDDAEALASAGMVEGE